MNTKKILLLTVTALAFAAGCAYAQSTNNVSLTPDQLAKLDTGINGLIPLLPASCQPYILKFIACIGLIGIVCRSVSGFARGGLVGVLSGLFSGHNGPIDPPPATVPKGAAGLAQKPLLILLLCLCPALFFVGCAATQVNENASGSGFKGEVSVPIPMSGGATLIGAKLTVGAWKSSSIVQPVSSNALYTAAIAIRQETHGSQNLSGNAGNGTNANAGIVAGESDTTSIVTGPASILSTNSATLESEPK